jgi:hypothetical protein
MPSRCWRVGHTGAAGLVSPSFASTGWFVDLGSTGSFKASHVLAIHFRHSPSAAVRTLEAFLRRKGGSLRLAECVHFRAGAAPPWASRASVHFPLRWLALTFSSTLCGSTAASRCIRALRRFWRSQRPGLAETALACWAPSRLRHAGRLSVKQSSAPRFPLCAGLRLYIGAPPAAARSPPSSMLGTCRACGLQPAVT